MGPARGAMGGMGGGLLGVFSMLSRFGWKGILVGIVVVGFMMFSGQCGGLGGMLGGGSSSRGAPPPS